MPISLVTNNFSSMLQVLHKLNFWKLTATGLLVLLTHPRSTWSFSLIHHWTFQSLLRTPKEENLSCSCFWCFHLRPYLTAKYQMFHDLQGLTKLLWKNHWSQHKIYLPASTRMMIKLRPFYLLDKNKLLSLAKIRKHFIKLAATKMCIIKYMDLQQKQLLKILLI